jgi:hypothetical protein
VAKFSTIQIFNPTTHRIETLVPAIIHIFDPTTHKIDTIELASSVRSRVFIHAETIARKFRLDIHAVQAEVAEMSTGCHYDPRKHPDAEFLYLNDPTSDIEGGPWHTHRDFLVNKAGVEVILNRFAVHLNKRAKQQFEWLMADFEAVAEVVNTEGAR